MLWGGIPSPKIISNRRNQTWNRIFFGLDLDPHAQSLCGSGGDGSDAGDDHALQEVSQIFFLKEFSKMVDRGRGGEGDGIDLSLRQELLQSLRSSPRLHRSVDLDDICKTLKIYKSTLYRYVTMRGNRDVRT